MRPSDEALDWQRRADAWAQQAESEDSQAVEPASRWSDVAATGRTTFPADGVGWRTETAEWRATGARWRQTTEWRSTTGSHGWRSTTEAWQTGGDESHTPPVETPAAQPAISSTPWSSPSTEPADSRPAWQQFADQPGTPSRLEQTPSWQQPAPRTPAESSPSWQQLVEPTPPTPNAPAWNASEKPAWQRGAIEGTATWTDQSDARDQSAASWLRPAEQPEQPSWQTRRDDGRHLVREDDRAAWRRDAIDPGESSPQIGRRRAPEAGSRTSGGTGWTARSDADNWAGHTDTGSIQLFGEPATPGTPTWGTGRYEEPSRGRPTEEPTGRRAQPEEPGYRIPPAAPYDAPGRRARADETSGARALPPGRWDDETTPRRRRAEEPTGAPQSAPRRGRYADEAPEPEQGYPPRAAQSAIGMPAAARPTTSMPADSRSLGLPVEGRPGMPPGGRPGVPPQARPGMPRDERPDMSQERPGMSQERPGMSQGRAGMPPEGRPTGMPADGQRLDDTRTGRRRRSAEQGADQRGYAADGPGYAEEDAAPRGFAGRPPAAAAPGRGTADPGKSRAGYNPGRDDWRDQTGSWEAEPDTSSWTRDPDTGQWSRADDDPRVLAWREEAARREDMGQAGGQRALPAGPSAQRPRANDETSVNGQPVTDDWRGGGYSGSAPSGSMPRGSSPRSGTPYGSAPTSAIPGGTPRGGMPYGLPPGNAPRNATPYGDAPGNAPRSATPYGDEAPGSAPRSATPYGSAPGNAPRSATPYGDGPDTGSRGAAPYGGAPRSAAPYGDEPGNARSATPYGNGPSNAPRSATPYGTEPGNAPRSATPYGDGPGGATPYGDGPGSAPRSATPYGGAPERGNPYDDAPERGRPYGGAPDRAQRGGGTYSSAATSAIPDGAARRDPGYGSAPAYGNPNGAPSGNPSGGYSGSAAASGIPGGGTPYGTASGGYSGAAPASGIPGSTPRSATPYGAPSNYTGSAPASGPPYGGSAAAPRSGVPQYGQPEDPYRSGRRRASDDEGPPPGRRAAPDSAAYGSPTYGSQASAGPTYGAQGSGSPAYGGQSVGGPNGGGPAYGTQVSGGPAYGSQAPTYGGQRAIEPAYGEAPLTPEVWRADDTESRQRRQSRRLGLAEEDGPSWSRGESSPEQDLDQAEWQRREREERSRGSATYRDGGDEDWRRELADRSELAEGESRRFGTADFVPFRSSGSAAVQGSSNLSMTSTSLISPVPREQREAVAHPQRAGNGFQSVTGSYERRAVTGSFPTSRKSNLLDPDDEEDEQESGRPYAAVGYTVAWYGVPVVLFVLYMLVISSGAQTHALDTLAKAAPQFGISLVLSVLVALGLRFVSQSWKAISVGLAAAVVGGGLATVLTSAITGNSLS